MIMRTVSEAMTPGPILVDPAMTVELAMAVARDKRIHHLLVQGPDGAINVVCLCDLLGRDPLDDSFDGARRQRGVPLSSFARRRTFVVGPAESLQAAASLMAHEGIGCLPVIEDGHVVGVLTRSDLGDASEPDGELGVGD